jgi:hypothetical protein
MPEKIKQVLFLLIRPELTSAQIAQVAEALQDNKDWSDLNRSAELYAVAALVFENLKRHGIDIPQHANLVFHSLLVRHKAIASARHDILEKILAGFAQKDIPSVLLKGVALSQLAFEQDWLRPMRDMDIMVPKGREREAADVLKDIGFDIPDAQPSKFMRFTHQLPDAKLNYKGFNISVEVHHNAFASDSRGNLYYQDVKANLQTVNWRGLEFKCMGHHDMLHHVARHLEALHPGSVLKLANVLDLILYSEKFQDEIDWGYIKSNHSHVINSLQCLHLIRPLSDSLISKIGVVYQSDVNGVGEIMNPLTAIFTKRNSFKTKLKMLFQPSDWWLHLFYNTPLNKSLFVTKFVRHPMTVAKWFIVRLYSRLLGG